MTPALPFALIACLLAAVLLSARQDLNRQQMKLLEDPGGWQYITVTDPDSGIQTQHTCFDGKPHPEECSGTLSFTARHTFVKDIYIHGQQVQRHGTYQLAGNQLAFYDELGTEDGPYTIAIDAAKDELTMDMPQIHIELMLERAYRDALQSAKRKPRA